MRKLLTTLLAITIIALALTAAIPAQVSAHTAIQSRSSAMYYPSRQQPLAITTTLKRGNWGNYYFSPTYISCRTYRTCVNIVNHTGRNVMILDEDNSIVSYLWNNRSTGPITLYVAGTYTYTDVQRNIRVPLTVTVVDNW